MDIKYSGRPGRAKTAMLIDYVQNQKAYKSFVFEAGGVAVSIDVVINELSTAALNTRYDSWNNKKMVYGLR